MTSGKYAALIFVVLTTACGGSKDSAGFQTVGRQPDDAPEMLNKELPFRYPPALFAQKIQGNVTLRIYIDRNGQIVPDSTHVAETSGFSALDSAAVKGSRELKFAPAKTQGQPVPVSILLPVFFRYPGATPLPGDSVLKGRPLASNTASSISDTPKASSTSDMPKAPTPDSLRRAVEAITKPAVKKPAAKSTKPSVKKRAAKSTKPRTPLRRKRTRR
ncbi:MAG: TonB family protein [Gemmatimonadaceae bacterium]|nr:TonB family protein [Gemmatimonadaceae bacterium]